LRLGQRLGLDEKLQSKKVPTLATLEKLQATSGKLQAALDRGPGIL